MVKKVIFLLAISVIFFVVLPTRVSFANACTSDKQDCRGVCIDKNNICLNLSYPSFGGFNLSTDQNLVQIIGWLYYAIVTISGLAAFVMLVYGGIQWLTSSGNPGQITQAKSRMGDALLGLALVLGSYIILTIINPGLTTLQQPSLETVKETPHQQSLSSSTILGCPLKNPDQYIITAGFHSSLYQKDYGTQHTGVDISTPEGTAVIAPADGVVVDPVKSNEPVEKPGPDCNNYLYVKHANGVYTKYCHLQSIEANIQNIAARQKIATSGIPATEGAGAHLHFQVWENGGWVNPREVVSCLAPTQMKCQPGPNSDSGGPDWCTQS